MELVPGIHRLEPFIGKKLVAHHLIRGDRSLLIDAGTPELAREALLPERANPLLGPFDFPPDLQFALEAHLAWLERQHKIRRLQRNGIAAWKPV